MSEQAYEFHYRRRVEFADTDMAGIVHFARIFCFAEEAEHAFLRSVGWSVHKTNDDEVIGFPRLATRFEFDRPLRFEDEVDVHLWVRRQGEKTLTYQFILSQDGEMAAHGEFTVICCRVHVGSRVESIPIPTCLADKLAEAPYPPLEFGGRGGDN